MSNDVPWDIASIHIDCPTLKLGTPFIVRLRGDLDTRCLVLTTSIIIPRLLSWVHGPARQPKILSQVHVIS